jgi:hypothetical protein
MNFVTGKNKNSLPGGIQGPTDEDHRHHAQRQRQHQQQPAQWTPTVTIPFSLSTGPGDNCCGARRGRTEGSQLNSWINKVWMKYINHQGRDQPTDVNQGRDQPTDANQGRDKPTDINQGRDQH